MIKCVVFDFDGTLVDSNAIKRQAFFDVAAPWDPSGEVVREVFARWPAANRYDKTRRIAEALISRELLAKDSCAESLAKRLADDYTVRCETAIARCAEMPGAGQALAALSAMGLHLYVNSATPHAPLLRLLQLRGWAGYFQGAFGAEASKAENLVSIANAAGLERGEMVHVGDQPDDRRGAELFGCRFVAMLPGADQSTAVGEHPLRVGDLRELPALLTGMSQEVS